MITVKKAVEKKEIECDFCHAVLEYEPSDVHDVWGGFGFTCPKCGNDVLVEEMITDRPIYPKNFFKFGRGGYIVSDDEIQEWCDDVFQVLRESKETLDFCSEGTGNATVIGRKFGNGEIDIVVAKDYEEYNYFPNDN